MATPVIVVLDEARDLDFEIIRQLMVLEQNAVLKRLVPALDLALDLRMARGAANVRDATVLWPFDLIASPELGHRLGQNPEEMVRATASVPK
jgi:hypothetical protein